MNRLAAILPVVDVLVDVDATSKKRAFEQAGLLFENQHGIARATVTDNLFAECTSEDLYAAIDQLMDKLDRQVVRHKDKVQDHHHAAAKRVDASLN